MATVVNNPQPSTSNNGLGFLLGAIVVILFVMLFFVYVLPLMRSSMSASQASQVSIPDKVDVNVKQK